MKKVYCEECANSKEVEDNIVCVVCPYCVSEMKELKEKETKSCKCKYCGLNLDEHDGSDFCPPGTEEFGGRR